MARAVVTRDADAGRTALLQGAPGAPSASSQPGKAKGGKVRKVVKPKGKKR
jgi:hypothetical protein